MNQHEQPTLAAISDEVTGWVKAAEAILNEQAAVSRAADESVTTLRGRRIDVRRDGELGWRAIPLRARDTALFHNIARKNQLPPISRGLRQQLEYLTGAVGGALRDLRAVTGVRRFFTIGSSRQKGQIAADFVPEYRSWFLGSTLPAELERLSPRERVGPVAVQDALADWVGFAAYVADFGGSVVVESASSFSSLPSAVETIQRAVAEEARVKAAAVTAGDDVRRKETGRLLAEMPVARLKEATREKLRVNALIEAGIETVGEVLRREHALENLQGIGETSAIRIRGAARTLLQTIYEEMPVRIDIKARTPEHTELLRRLRAWKGIRDLTGSPTQRARVEDLSPFAWAVQKDAAHALLFCPSSLTPSDFREAIGEVAQRAQAISQAHPGATTDDPWDDFLARPADYFALLAELGFITEDEQKTHGDLPDDIVDAVRALELKTEHLKALLRGYQSFAARFALVQRKVIIGDEMGLGKTVEAIAVLAHLRAKGSHHALVICPAAVVTNWAREVSSKSTLSAHRIHGPDRLHAARSWIRHGGVGVTTFETLSWLHSSVLDRPVLGCVVVDEAHYIKNPVALRTQRTTEIIRACERAMLLTGTPLENRLDEFRNLVSYLRPDLIVDGNELAPRRFRRQVAPAYLRRNQEDVLTELPSLVEVDEWLPMSREDLTAYSVAVSDGNFMAMRQAATTQGAFSTKLERLVEITKEAEDNGRRVVVFSYFREVLNQVAQMMPGQVFGPLTGSVPATHRQTMVDQFSAAGHGAVLVAQITAGGVGLNIQAASVVVICEPQLKPTTEWQAVARAQRMGQLESVQVHRLLSEEGVDNRIREILARKKELFEDFARESDTADSAPEAFDISEAELAREVIADERQRLFGQATADTSSH